jgi:signal transduction histidine kinase
MIELPCAEGAGAAIAERGGGSDEPVRLVLTLGRALDGVATQAGVLDPLDSARLRRVVDEAAARAAAAHARFGHERREAWLSLFSHELKNPLNTVLSALWLLREQRPPPPSERFLDLAERAVRRIEAEIRELRHLHRKAAVAAPSREAASAGGKV